MRSSQAINPMQYEFCAAPAAKSENINIIYKQSLLQQAKFAS